MGNTHTPAEGLLSLCTPCIREEIYVWRKQQMLILHKELLWLLSSGLLFRANWGLSAMKRCEATLVLSYS
ncbi:hypothetical protein KDI_26810 [Dictyobacter arantiisoli]|uniref:Uncharacterized protein n=1 Tax=Dictyobacter arantiisoli TaxID=2014874 RepID=A0A5A5TCP2_9CHLR|nr:hypothetical protein KDI_26810 [Dictyobacter arantiisoli]